jgi:ankyrin repeat protein
MVKAMGGLTPLLHAARQGHMEAVRALVEAGADVNTVSAGDGSSPLLIAAINGRFDIGMYLLVQGADPNLTSHANVGPLYGAVNVHWAPHAFYPQPTTRHEKTTHVEFMRALLEAGADPDARVAMKVWYTGYNFDQSGVDEIGATAFWRAAQSSDVEVMRLLIEHGADPDIWTKVPAGRQRGGAGSGEDYPVPPIPPGGPAVSPLHAATGSGYDGNYHRNAPVGWLPAVKFLVDELGFDVNMPDHQGNTPLHNAAFRGDNEMILYLVEKGADVMAVNRSGQTTVDKANGPIQRLQPFPETMKLLEGMGAINNHKCVSC